MLETLTPDMIFKRMDADRVYAARRADADKTAARQAQREPDLTQYAAPQLHQTYQEYKLPQYISPDARGMGSDAEIPASENQPPASAESRGDSRINRPRSGTYSRLMASHDRMGTRHLG